MVARNTNVPFKGRIQKRKTHDLQIITFDLQRAARPVHTDGPFPDMADHAFANEPQFALICTTRGAAGCRATVADLKRFC